MIFNLLFTPYFLHFSLVHPVKTSIFHIYESSYLVSSHHLNESQHLKLNHNYMRIFPGGQRPPTRGFLFTPLTAACSWRIRFRCFFDSGSRTWSHDPPSLPSVTEWDLDSCSPHRKTLRNSFSTKFRFRCPFDLGKQTNKHTDTNVFFAWPSLQSNEQ